VIYTDGTHYMGYLKDGHKHGIGKLYASDTASILKQGRWKQGEHEGYEPKDYMNIAQISETYHEEYERESESGSDKNDGLEDLGHNQFLDNMMVNMKN